MSYNTHDLPADVDMFDEEYVMPCAEALMAGTLALMTGHARCASSEYRNMMANKAASNLLALSQHPQMSASLRAVARKLHEQWTELIKAEHVNQLAVARCSLQLASESSGMTRAEESRALWHITPEVIQ